MVTFNRQLEEFKAATERKKKAAQQNKPRLGNNIQRQQGGVGGTGGTAGAGQVLGGDPTAVNARNRAQETNPRLGTSTTGDVTSANNRTFTRLGQNRTQIGFQDTQGGTGTITTSDRSADRVQRQGGTFSVLDFSGARDAAQTGGGATAEVDSEIKRIQKDRDSGILNPQTAFQQLNRLFQTKASLLNAGTRQDTGELAQQRFQSAQEQQVIENRQAESAQQQKTIATERKAEESTIKGQRAVRNEIGKIRNNFIKQSQDQGIDTELPENKDELARRTLTAKKSSVDKIRALIQNNAGNQEIISASRKLQQEMDALGITVSDKILSDAVGL